MQNSSYTAEVRPSPGAGLGRPQAAISCWHRRVEHYFDDQHPKPPAFAPSCTACWRGYVARWCIKRGRLYLEKLEPFCYVWPDTDEIEFTIDAATGLSVPTMPNYLAQLFPASVAPVFAEWFTGELCYLPLKFYWGKHHVSESEALEAASVMRVERGCVVAAYK